MTAQDTAVEANFDGLVGPTHNYAGLSFGNLASQANAARVANPKAAARQGLDKMRALAERGFRQAVLPPHERPSLELLRALGFGGTDQAVLQQAARQAPALLAAAGSAAAMWAANAATVSPSADTPDGRVHFTPANLCSKLHRSLEADTTGRILRAVFNSAEHFTVHAPLPGSTALGDEGAANHTRLCAGYGAPGVECFVYGRSEYGGGGVGPPPRAPGRFPARQTREASEAVARLHGLPAAATVFAQQHPEAIDAGVFHNDVIAVGNRDVLFCHAGAFLEQAAVYDELRRKLAARGASLRVIEVSHQQLSLQEAVSSYLFNSQLLARADGGNLLVVPRECREQARVAAYLDQLVVPGGPIDELLVFDLHESMRNGGGPACLRLRVALTAPECAAVNPRVWLDAPRCAQLEAWIERHYRDRLAPGDLADPALLDESRTALDELTGLLDLGAIYAFQR
jgi:succinylarginine dihydrolase